jgi:hypothetical protein
LENAGAAERPTLTTAALGMTTTFITARPDAVFSAAMRTDLRG